MNGTDGNGHDLGKLYAALALARKAFPPIERTRTVRVRTRDGGSYEFAYAPLDTIFAATVGPLADQGLVLTQLLDGTDLVTKLGHQSGAELVSRMAIPQSDQIQQLGSAITYIRRYSAQAMLGLAAEEDDDGNTHDGNRVEAREDKPEDPRMLRVGPFGPAKGQMVGALSDKELEFYLSAYAKDVADPAKAQWKASNEKTLRALEAERQRRTETAQAPFKYQGEAPPPIETPAKPIAPFTEAERPKLIKDIKRLADLRKLTEEERMKLGASELENVPLGTAPLTKLVAFRDFLADVEFVEKWREHNQAAS